MQVVGRLKGFRFKDWSDFEVTTSNCLTNEDNIATTSFQCYKKYEYDAGYTNYKRKIVKLVNGTFKLYKDAVLQTETTDYTVNYNTGVITIVAFNSIATYTFSTEFDVPVRFDTDALNISIDQYNNYSMPCKLTEIRI